MLKHLVTIPVLSLLSCYSVAAFAGETVINQKDRKFSESAITVKVGDTITFMNDDNVAHNAFSRSAGNEFELPQQKQGEKNSVTMKAPGEVKVQCAMHPQMKLTIKVE